MAVAPAPKRRTILKGAAWSTPVIEAAIGAQAASGSDGGCIPNSDADFFWATSAAADCSTLSALVGERQMTYSTQISYRSAPWRNPTGLFLLSITFNVQVSLLELPASWTLITPSSGMGPETMFTFAAAASSGGHHVSAKFVPLAPAEVTAFSSMSLLNGGATTWAQDPAVSTAVFAL